MTERPLCACGCGRPVNRASRNYPERGIRKGDPLTYRKGHHLRGSSHHSWKGGRTQTGKYARVLRHGHPRAETNGYVYEHILVVEAVRGGRALPDGAEVHHVNGDGTDNRPQNLIVCQDHEYHMLLERRGAALAECGHAGWFKCKYCKAWSDPSRMVDAGSGNEMCHPRCRASYLRAYRRRNRGPR